MHKLVVVTFHEQILLWHLDTRGFSKMFDPCIGEIVAGTLEVYRSAATHLRPTPSRSHYIFNLRDFFRVIQVRLCFFLFVELMDNVSCIVCVLIVNKLFNFHGSFYLKCEEFGY